MFYDKDEMKLDFSECWRLQQLFNLCSRVLINRK